MTEIPPNKLDPELSDFDFTTFETAIARVRNRWLEEAKVVAFDLFAGESFEKSAPKDFQLEQLSKLRRIYEELLAAYSEMKKLSSRRES